MRLGVDKYVVSISKYKYNYNIMSSKIDPAKMNRIERGSPKSLDDLPAKIQDVLKSIYQTC
jgi:hypothetical protein